MTLKFVLKRDRCYNKNENTKEENNLCIHIDFIDVVILTNAYRNMD